MARELALDVLEQIFVRLDVKYLIRCKSVCKSWQSFISSPRFVNAHLKLAYANDRNNPELGHRRIHICGVRLEDHTFYYNNAHVVGSCNGLLCVSPKDVEFVVTNPSTREHKKLPTPPYGPYNRRKLLNIRDVVCWGFGYDSSADDYKVIAGFEKRKKRYKVVAGLEKRRERTVFFHALTLKSNTWKLIGQVKCEMRFGSRTGILCGGTLHWLMDKKEVVIISLDLSTEEFKEIPLTDTDLLDDCGYHDYKLGVMEECLCIHSRGILISSRYYPSSTKKWVMKKNKWEPYIDDHCQSKYDVAHYLSDVYICDDGRRVPSDGDFVRASIFVKSLVSPHPHPYVKQQGHEGNDIVESGALGKRKRNKMRKGGSCKHKTPLLKRLLGYKFI